MFAKKLVSQLQVFAYSRGLNDNCLLLNKNIIILKKK